MAKLRIRNAKVSTPIAETPSTGKKTRGKKESIVASPSSSEAESSKNSKRSRSRSLDVTDEDITKEESQLGSNKRKITTTSRSSKASVKQSKKQKKARDSSCKLRGSPYSATEAQQNWPHRYDKSKKGEKMLALRHYSEAVVDGIAINLHDDVFVKGEDNKPDYIAKVVELFESTDKKPYFTAQWYYRHTDTVIEERVVEELMDRFDERRVFLSEIRDENPLSCIVSKLKIVHLTPNIGVSEVPQCDFYCDMAYSLAYSTFSNLPKDSSRKVQESLSTVTSETSCDSSLSVKKGVSEASTLGLNGTKSAMKLLDLYSGCGAMSTGLCLGAAISGINLETRWAVDMNEHACKSLKFNHPETEVRNENAEDFLLLLKKWNELCGSFGLLGDHDSEIQSVEPVSEEEDDDSEEDESEDSSEVFEVENLIGIRVGEINDKEERGLLFKVQWKGYDSSYDTWEPIDNLGNCPEKIKEYVTEGYKSNILPLPGSVDVVCGGPPCQGVSGFNRFRNYTNPLKDPKNSQMIVFMDIVEFLHPRYVLMENVTDLLKFVQGYLGKYAIGRLVAMKYQARLGLMAAGSYGLPQFRMRAFLWGARPTENLPQFPLPTHATIGRPSVPVSFESNLVGRENDESCKLEKALTLGDAISDLPRIQNDESRDERPYEGAPKTEFQRQIRRVKLQKAMLYDHRSLKLNEDDYMRVCRIPKEKGANFRMLPGVLVGSDNKVYWDPDREKELLPSGSQLVPDYAMTFVKGKSTKPFGRLWWDEIVPTVVTRAEPHNQRILHPLQDRVLSIRENARIQGFPDYYKLFGPIKERYMQVGNAVAVPVARALGYALGLASKGNTGDEPLVSLPPKFPNCC